MNVEIDLVVVSDNLSLEEINLLIDKGFRQVKIIKRLAEKSAGENVDFYAKKLNDLNRNILQLQALQLRLTS